MVRLFSIVAFLVGSSLGSPHFLAQAEDLPFAFTNVTVIDVRDGEARSGMTIVVSGDRITAVGPVDKVDVPVDARMVEANDKYLIPGLWDMHAHTMSIPIARNIYFPLFIANGVTGIRTMKTDCFESEQPDCSEEGLADPIPSIYDVKRWREEIRAGTLIGPRIVAGSAMLDGTEPGKPSTVDASTPFAPATAEHVRQHARILQERSVDFAKIYNFIPRDAYFAFADEANRLGLPFAGHVPEGVRASEASEAGQRSIEHAGSPGVGEECSAREDEIRRRLRAELESDDPQIIPIWLDMVESYDAVKCAKVYETLVRNGTWVTPTLVSGGRADREIEFWRDDPRRRYLTREEREWWSNRAEDFDVKMEIPEHAQTLAQFERDVTLAQHRAGVPLLAGSDPPGFGVFAGFGLHDELEVLVAIGLTEAEALRTATLEPARYLKAVDTQGTVEVGKVADLVLLEANPLEDISNTQKIRAVVANGRFFDRPALDELLADVEKAANPQGQSTETEEVEAAVRAEVEEQHRQEQKAFIEGDCETVASFYSDEATRYLAGRRVGLLEGLEFCRKLPRPFGQRYGSPEINDAFHVLSDNAVYFVRTIDFQPSDDDPSLFKREVVTKVWQKTNDEWKIVHFHSSVHSVQVQVQGAEVPRTRILPGIESPAFPYAQPEEVGLSSEKLARLSDEIVEWVAAGELVGAELLIVKDGRAVFHEAYGWADQEERRPMERNSIFSIKSMTKPFTAQAILMLEDEGKLSLDDLVSRYIRGFAGDKQTTIRHLLTHTSGYEGLGSNLNSYDSLREWVEGWGAREPTRPFGEFSYSDFNYAALGYVIESASGMPADAFLEERIIRPLGLDETRTAFARDAPWAARANSRYLWDEEAGGYQRYWTHRERQEWDHFPAAWGLWATAMDYAEFMTMWMNQGRYEGVRLLSEEAVEEALRAHAPIAAGAYAAFAYGFGWTIKEAPRSDGMPFLFSHGGYDGTEAYAFPGSDAIVIFLTHSRGGGHRNALMNRLSTLEVFDQPGPYSVNLVWAGDREVAEAELAPEERARYVGAYRWRNADAGDVPERLMRVWEEGGRLHVRVGGLGERADWRLNLVPLGDHRFSIGRYRGQRLEAISPGTVRFMMEDGEAKALEVMRESEVFFTAARADPAQILADIDRLQDERAAARNRQSVADIVLESLEAEGIDFARALHRELIASRPDSVRFGEVLLGRLGYRLLREERIEESIAVLGMNIEAYPERPRAHSALGDALRASGRLEDARRSYERAVELAEQQEHKNLPTYRSEVERVTQQIEGEQ